MDIELLGAHWPPKLPASFVRRQEIVLAYRQGIDGWHQIRVWGAALGLTWDHPDRSRTLDARLESHGYDPNAYGEAVAEELLAAGVAAGEIISQGAIAFNAIAMSILPQKEVDARAGFSETAAEGTPPLATVPTVT